MVLFRDWGDTAPLLILDVSNPVVPKHLCTLSPAQSGRFLSATKVAFSADDRLGLADLSNGTVLETAHLPSVTYGGAFSRDGSRFAYRLYDDKGGMTMHLWSQGKDKTLYTQEPVGGHGGPGWAGGPVARLQFSPDGQELLDYLLFRPMTGPANLLVFKVDGTVVFQYKGQTAGVWHPTGSVLYFWFWPAQPPSTEIDSVDASGQRRIVASGLSLLSWPSMAPDSQSIVYTSFDDASGLPHLSRFDLAKGATTQLSTAIAAETVFVTPTVVWTNQGKPCECGPGGNSTPDGVMIAHELATGRDATVDMSFYPADDLSRGGLLYAEDVLDASFATN
jgi:Tol biopolymer transport system component